MYLGIIRLKLWDKVKFDYLRWIYKNRVTHSEKLAKNKAYKLGTNQDFFSFLVFLATVAILCVLDFIYFTKYKSQTEFFKGKEFIPGNRSALISCGQ